MLYALRPVSVPTFLLLATLIFLPAASRGASYLWDGGGANDNWSAAANWNPDVAPVSSIDTTIIFAGNTRLTPQEDIAGNFLLNALTFDATAGAFVLGGNPLDFRTSSGSLLPLITQNSASNITINEPLILTNTLTARVSGAGTLTLGGAISGASGLSKQGPGTLILTKANSYAGGTGVDAGTLRLDFSASGAPASNIILSTSTLGLSGGTLALQGSNAAATNSAQTFASTTIYNGASAAALTSGTGGSTTLALGAITRNTGGTVVFTLPASGSINTSSGTASTILKDASGAAYATLGNDWAAKNAANTSIVAGSSIAGFYTASTASALSGNADIANGTAATTLSAVSTSLSSLRFNAAQATTINVGAGHTLQTGGILVTSAVGAANLSQINGGTLQGSSGGDLVIIQNNAANGLTIGSVIANNGAATGLTKAGAGTLTLNGANTYTGETRVNAGTLNLGSTGSITRPTGTTFPNDAEGFLVDATGTLNINGGSITVGGAGGNNTAFVVSATASSSAAVTLGAGGVGGTLSTTRTYVGEIGSGAFTQSSGTHTATDILALGYTTAGNGTYNLSGSSSSKLSTFNTYVGFDGIGTFNQSGGDHTASNALFVGGNSPQGLSSGTYNLSAGTVTTTQLIVGSTGAVSSAFNQTGGAVTVNDLYVAIGSDPGQTGSYNLSVGTLTAPETDVGYSGNGTFTQTSGTHTVTGAGGFGLEIGYSSGSSGVYHLNGGTLQTVYVAGGGGGGTASTLNFNGGVLQAASDNADFVRGLTNASVRAGGAKIDSNAHAITINQALVHDSALGATADGGLAKQGAGTLTLTGANTYTGPTVVNAGALLVNGSLGSTGAPAGTVSTLSDSNAVLGGSGVIHAPVTMARATTLAPGATGDGSTATLGVGALTLQRNSSLSIELNNTTPGSGYDQLSLTGTLSINGTLLVTAGAGLQQGDKFYIALNDGVDPISGVFTAPLLNEGTIFSSGGYAFQISYLANGDSGSLGNDIALTVVPEPATWLAGIMAAGMLIYGQRRRTSLTRA